MPQEVSAELRRVTERWHGLPEARAHEAAPLVRGLVDELADELVGGLAGGSGQAAGVPDLGPQVLPDQLAVLVHDACLAGRPGVLERLTRLRRAL